MLLSLIYRNPSAKMPTDFFFLCDFCSALNELPKLSFQESTVFFEISGSNARLFFEEADEIAYVVKAAFMCDLRNRIVSAVKILLCVG